MERSRAISNVVIIKARISFQRTLSAKRKCVRVNICPVIRATNFGCHLMTPAFNLQRQCYVAPALKPSYPSAIQRILKHCRYPRIIPILIHYHRASLSTISFCRLARLSDLSLRRLFVEIFDLGEGTIGLGGFTFGLGFEGSPEGPHGISCP